MFFDQFDKDAMRVIMDAQSEARNLGGAEVGTQHILLAATLQKDSVQKSLERGGLATDEMRRTIAPNKANGLPPLDKLFAATSKDELLPFAKDTERAFRASLNRCQAEGSLVSSKELILSVLQDEQADTSALKVLLDMKLDRSQLYDEVQKGELELVGAGGKRGGKNSTLAQCSVDLTARAREGKLDPVVGRSDEVRRCLQVLVRRRQNNPVLLGDPGVGKTAIAEGLAQLIVDGKVPAKLLNKRLLSLELGMLVADTKYRGEFEERLKSVVDEVTASNDTILFIDELHTLVGAGAAEGAIDAANLLKPAPRAASCSASARRRSPSTGATSRRTRRSSGASSRSTCPSRRSQRRWRSCAACRTSTPSTTRSPTPRRRSGGGGQAGGAVHQRPLPARQGDRPD